jgi:hypothetical protein
MPIDRSQNVSTAARSRCLFFLRDPAPDVPSGKQPTFYYALFLASVQAVLSH